MPPALASCLFGVFIVWSLLRDRKNSQDLSRASWLPTVWISLIGTKGLAYWLNGGQYQQSLFVQDSGLPVDALAFTALTISGWIVLYRRQLDWGDIFRRNRIVWIFYAYLFISVVWSDFPFISFKRYIKELGNVAMILLIITENNPLAAIRYTFLRCAMVFIPMSVLFIKYYGELGRYYNPWTGEAGFSGVTTSKNELGRLAMWSALFLIWTIFGMVPNKKLSQRLRENIHHFIVLSMCAWILLTAKSSTSLGCFAIGIAALVVARTSIAKLNSGLLIFCTGGFLLLSFLFFTMPELRGMVASHFGKSADLTERTDVWNGCLAADTNPILGEGFFSFWMTEKGQSLGRKLWVTEAHNGFLETYLNSGLIGVVLLLAVIMKTATNVASELRTDSTTGPLFAALFAIALCYNNTEAAFNNNNIVGFLLFLVVFRYGKNAEVAMPEDERSSQDSNRPATLRFPC